MSNEPPFISAGVHMIAAERARQVSAEGWTTEHDAEHVAGEMLRAAVSYGITAVWQQFGVDDVTAGEPDPAIEWPWDAHWYKPGADAVTTLVKAGALIAAEIDRLTGGRSVIGRWHTSPSAIEPPFDSPRMSNEDLLARIDHHDRANEPPFDCNGIVWAWAPIEWSDGTSEPHLVADSPWAQEHHPGPRIIIESWRYADG